MKNGESTFHGADRRRVRAQEANIKKKISVAAMDKNCKLLYVSNIWIRTCIQNCQRFDRSRAPVLRTTSWKNTGLRRGRITA
uniref:Uncharacterized protein n=1 Tax=Anguilla anguilla TaxID=7936 RepID=A0A0E9WYB4_ANGAN